MYGAPVPAFRPASPWLVDTRPDPGPETLAQLAYASTKSGWPDQPAASSFALIDGARLPGISAILDTRDLEHASLFQGAALQELDSVAPWIIRLAPEDRLAERFLTPMMQDGPHWHYWGRGAVTILRSTADMPSLVSHFRKYTRIYDEARGKWNYFRFYAPETLRSMIAYMEPEAFHAFAAPVQFFITESESGDALCLGSEPARIKAFLQELPPC